MGDTVNFPISLDSDLGRELIVDWCDLPKVCWTNAQ